MKGSRIAVIPARGGSKRIPRKNVVDFLGKPLIAWTIEAAAKSGLFDEILVSTEDGDIADVAKTFGANVPFLRRTAYDDVTPVSEATIDALRQYEALIGHIPATVVQLLPSCPLRTVEDISLGFEAFTKSGQDFQISCSDYGFQNPWWSIMLSEGGTGKRLFPAAFKKRSQDLQKLYCPSGAVWIARSAALIASGSFYGKKTSYCPMPWLSSFDIDSHEDLQMARLLAAKAFADSATLESAQGEGHTERARSSN